MRRYARAALIVFSFLSLFLTASQSAFSAPLSLEDCYQIALKERETLKQREQEIKAAEARYQQAFAELYPQLGVGANQRVRDNENFGSLSSGSFNDPSTGLPRSRTLGVTQFETLVTFTQPIFRGFREFAVSRAVDAERAALDQLLERDKQLLFQDVSDLYYQILLFHDQEASITQGEKVFQDRIKELNDFISLGKSKESEVHAAEADLAQQRLAKERARRSKDASREVLASLLRIPSDALHLSPAPPVVAPSSVQPFLDKMKRRADIRAAELTEQRSRELITAEERAWWPAINLDANAYAVDDPNRHRDWDMLLRFNMPIFDGGRINSRVAERQAELGRRQSETAERARVAEMEVRQSFVRVEHSKVAMEQAKALQAARKKNFHSQQADYKNGRVTNLDVMNALTMLQVAELEVIGTTYTFANDISQLRVAAGEVAP